ncbi:MAG: hypothetical protein LBR82_02030 [Desulfovibrio sp.]|jgi:hypothetical protein|nr:hypothetical protein [Desulfovibrio sp.]
MIAVLGKLLGFLTPTFITTALERVFSSSAKVEEMRAEIELLEARAFARGRYSPKYIIRFAMAFLFIACGIALLVSVFAPDFRADDMIQHLRTMIGLAQEAQQ